MTYEGSKKCQKVSRNLKGSKWLHKFCCITNNQYHECKKVLKSSQGSQTQTDSGLHERVKNFSQFFQNNINVLKNAGKMFQY
jgi:hypothetical protein